MTATEKTTNHLNWALMFFIGSPILILLCFAFAWGTVGPFAVAILPILMLAIPIGVVIGWVRAVSKTKAYNATISAKRHKEMMDAIVHHGGAVIC